MRAYAIYHVTYIQYNTWPFLDFNHNMNVADSLDKKLVGVCIGKFLLITTNHESIEAFLF